MVQGAIQSRQIIQVFLQKLRWLAQSNQSTLEKT